MAKYAELSDRLDTDAAAIADMMPRVAANISAAAHALRMQHVELAVTLPASTVDRLERLFKDSLCLDNGSKVRGYETTVIGVWLSTIGAAVMPVMPKTAMVIDMARDRLEVLNKTTHSQDKALEAAGHKYEEQERLLNMTIRRDDEIIGISDDTITLRVDLSAIADIIRPAMPKAAHRLEIVEERVAQNNKYAMDLESKLRAATEREALSKSNIEAQATTINGLRDCVAGRDRSIAELRTRIDKMEAEEKRFAEIPVSGDMPHGKVCVMDPTQATYVTLASTDTDEDRRFRMMLVSDMVIAQGKSAKGMMSDNNKFISNLFAMADAIIAYERKNPKPSEKPFPRSGSLPQVHSKEERADKLDRMYVALDKAKMVLQSLRLQINGSGRKDAVDVAACTGITGVLRDVDDAMAMASADYSGKRPFKPIHPTITAFSRLLTDLSGCRFIMAGIRSTTSVPYIHKDLSTAIASADAGIEKAQRVLESMVQAG